jgi:purine-cytosine permease-like protein
MDRFDKMTNDLSDIRKKYAISKHHAWAGSILLAILLAVRIFFVTSNINEYNQIILIIGLFIIIYMIISLIFTYKYRLGLTVDEKPINLSISSNNIEKSKNNEKFNKNIAKIEKKKAKEKLKELKKSK